MVNPFQTVEARQVLLSKEPLGVVKANGGYYSVYDSGTVSFYLDEGAELRIFKNANFIERLFAKSMLPRELNVASFHCGPMPIAPTLGGIVTKYGYCDPVGIEKWSRLWSGY